MWINFAKSNPNLKIEIRTKSANFNLINIMETAIVTAASSGKGFCISKELLHLGYKVYGFGCDFSKSELKHNNFIPVKLDLTDTSLLCNKIKSINKTENITILINNAGVGYFDLHEELNPKKIHEMITINLEVPLILSNLLLKIASYSLFILNNIAIYLQY